MKCLEKAPRSRFADLAALAATLAPFGPPNAGDLAARVSRALVARVEDEAASGPVSAQTSSRPSLKELGPTLDARTAQTWAGAMQSGQRSRAPRIVAMAVAVAAAGLGAGWLLLRRPVVPEAAMVAPPSAPPAAAVAPVAVPSSAPVPSPLSSVAAGADPVPGASPEAGVVVAARPPPKPAAKPQPPRPPHPPAPTPKPQPSSVDPNARAGARFD